MYRGFNIKNISFEGEIGLVQQYESTVINIDINEDLINFLYDDYVFDGSVMWYCRL